MSLAVYQINGNQPQQSVRGVRAFKVLNPSLNGASFQVDSGGIQNIIAGHLYELQPKSGASSAPATTADVETNRLLRELLAVQTGQTIEQINAALGGPATPPAGNPKQYPTVTFINGTSSLPLVVVVDQVDGNEYVPGALGNSDTIPIAQEWDFVPYGTSVPALNGTQPGVLGVPVLYKDSSSGRLFIPTGSNGVPAVNAALPFQQVFDTTAAGGAAVNSGTMGTSGGNPYGHLLVRIAGLTAASTRVIQLLAVRSDASTVVIASSTFGAAITDFDFGAGTAEAIPAAPIVGSTTMAGFSYGGMLPANWQINLTSGAVGDNPRVTIWTRTIA